LLEASRCDLQLGRLSAHRGGIEAALAPRSGDRFALLVDTEPCEGWASVFPALREELARHRLRFRVAHEVGHSFFYDRSGPRPRRLAPNSAAQERWCDRFASALLLPPLVVSRASPTCETLLDLHRKFDVSLQAAARALARVQRERFVAVLVARGRRPPFVRVQWQKSHGGPMDRWWAAGELQSVLEDGYRTGTLRLRWPDGSRAASWHGLPGRAQILVVA
jgi:IrrE N-terminal-like domain